MEKKKKKQPRKGSEEAANGDGAKQGGRKNGGKKWKSQNGGYAKKWDSWSDPRKAKRLRDRGEIDELEARVLAEAPKSGQGIGKGPAGRQAGAAGPALTASLFAELPLSRRTKQGLKAGGFVKMTEIQRGAIPHALAGRDILGEARTGSGKTLAFVVPLIELLFRRKWSSVFGLGGLIVSPTRELAYQIYQVLTTVGSEHEISAGCIVGGRSLEEEQKAVSNMNVLVATPGRLLQHLDESPGFVATDLQMLVLDEADRILDFGFQETVTHILGQLPSERQTLLFSATLHTSVHRLGRAALRSPEIVSVHRDATSRTPERLKQVYMVMPLEKKVDMLYSFLRSHSTKKIIVFVSACKQVRFLYEAFRLLKPGLLMMELHGRQSLTKRMIVFQEFTEREGSAALVCTDIAARGVDFPVVDWVVQVDCPDSVDSYIHRVGRTARYESTGHSALFLLPSEEKFAEKLRTARVAVQNISPKSTKLVTIQGKLAALLAGNGAIRHLAQKAFSTYIRSIHLMKDKEVFNVQQLAREAFATSMGLSDVPPLGSLDEEAADIEKNPMRKMKNMTPLQRLKQKIKAKKEEKKLGEAGSLPGASAAADDESEGEAAMKKPGKWARRQRRIAAVANSAKAGAEEAVEEGDEDLLQPVAEPSAVVKEQRPGGKKRLKLRRGGVAQGTEGQHVFFAASGAVGSELGQLADELGGGAAEEEEESGGRQAFLQEVAQDLAVRDVGDKAANRARLAEGKKKRRRLERQDDEEEPMVTLGGASSRSASPAGGASEASEDEAPETEVASPAATRRRAGSPPARRQPPPSRGAARAAPAAAPAAAAAAPPASAADSLEALEREALSRLGGGGLFA